MGLSTCFKIRLACILNDYLLASCRVRNLLLVCVSSLLRRVSNDFCANGLLDADVCPLCFLFHVNLLVPFLLFPVQALDELVDRRHGVHTRVLTTGSVLLHLLSHGGEWRTVQHRERSIEERGGREGWVKKGGEEQRCAVQVN